MRNIEKFQICRLGSHRNFACLKRPLFKSFQKWPNMANFSTENNTYCFRIGPAFLDTLSPGYLYANYTSLVMLRWRHIHRRTRWVYIVYCMYICIVYSTDYYQRLTLQSWFSNLEQSPLNRSQKLPAPYKQLIDEIKQNYLRENDWRTDNLTNNSQLLTVTIDGSKRTNDITSLHSR